MRKNEMIKIEKENFDKIFIDYDLNYLRLENELSMIDYIENELEIDLYNYNDFDIYDSNLISRKNENFEILLDRYYSLYYDEKNDLFHYFFEIRDIDNEDEIIFSIEIFNEDSDNLDNIYEIIKNYINYLIDYNKKIFDEEN